MMEPKSGRPTQSTPGERTPGERTPEVNGLKSVPEAALRAAACRVADILQPLNDYERALVLREARKILSNDAEGKRE